MKKMSPKHLRGWHSRSRRILLGAALAVSSTIMPARSAAVTQVDWPMFGNTSNQQRYAALDQVNASTIGRLGVAWSISLGAQAALWEDDPVVVGGVMYVTNGTDEVMALHADTGRRIWTYAPVVDFLRAFARAGLVAPVNRGVTVADGRVYLATFDEQLISLDSANGKVVWRSVIADPSTYYEDSPPSYWHGSLYVGEAASGLGTRGFVAAFSAKTGKPLWRFYTVPAPGHSWAIRTGRVGGGDVWMPVTVDPATGTLYVGTGNPTPDLVGQDRPGCDVWTDSTLALDARTGKLLWGRTQVCHDVWDYDSAQSPMLLPIRHGTSEVAAVGEGSKAGRFWVFEARTGAVISVSSPLGEQTIPRPVPTPMGVRVCPGIYGSLEYSPPAYSPVAGLVYLPGLNLCTVDRALPAAPDSTLPAGVAAFGGTAKPSGDRNSGFLAAVDPATGRIRWLARVSRPMIGGALATAANLVFSGADDGYLYAFDARNGATVWREDFGLGFGAAPFTYMVDGIQYVAVAAGGSGEATITGARTGALLVAFRLGGRPAPCSVLATCADALPHAG